MTVRTRTFSQAPKAVRSARGRWWDWKFPAGPCAYRAFHAYKRDALGLTVQVYGLGNEASPAAFRAVVRTHSVPPSLLSAFSPTSSPVEQELDLRYESRTKARQTRERKRGKKKRTTPIFSETEAIPASLLKCMRKGGRTRSARSTEWKARLGRPGRPGGRLGPSDRRNRTGKRIRRSSGIPDEKVVPPY